MRAAHAPVPRATVRPVTTRPSWRARSARRSPAACRDRTPRAAAAAAAVLRYASATQPGVELPIARVDVYQRTDTLIIDEQARRHLELTESLLDRRRAGSLIEALDETRTAMGGRLLRRWLLFPLGGRRHDPAPSRRRGTAGGGPRGA